LALVNQQAGTVKNKNSEITTNTDDTLMAESIGAEDKDNTSE